MKPNELKEKVINDIIDKEGFHSNDADDSGGKTTWGITEAVARASGWTGRMKDLPVEKAKDIYCERYWDSMCCDEIAETSIMICEELCDTAVNMGVSRASSFLQRSLNILNNRQELYPDIEVDGKIGTHTTAVLQAYLIHRPKEGEQILFNMLNCLQGAKYIALAERRESQQRFIYGWMKNRVELR